MSAVPLDRLESLIPHRDESNPTVSAWSVGRQVYHCLIATKRIAEELAASTPGGRRQSRSFLRAVINLTGWITRGRGKAPKEAHPPESPTEEELRSLLAEARDALEKARGADPEAWWDHFAFGVMRRDTALRFLDVHNRHHLKIIGEIRRGNAGIGASR